MLENKYTEVYTECYGKITQELNQWIIEEAKKQAEENVFKAKLKHESIYKPRGLK